MKCYQYKIKEFNFPLTDMVLLLHLCCQEDADELRCMDIYENQ